MSTGVLVSGHNFRLYMDSLICQAQLNSAQLNSAQLKSGCCNRRCKNEALSDQASLGCTPQQHCLQVCMTHLCRHNQPICRIWQRHFKLWHLLQAFGHIASSLVINEICTPLLVIIFSSWRTNMAEEEASSMCEA